MCGGGQWLHWLFLGCSETGAGASGMYSLVRRLLIGYFSLLSGSLYCCSSQRKSRGERIISQLIPTILISHHSLPQPLICRRVSFFILGYKLPVSPPPLPDRPALSPLFSTGMEQEAERTLAVKFPGRGVGTPPPHHQWKQRLMEKQAKEINSPLHCETPSKLKIITALWHWCSCSRNQNHYKRN